MSKLKVNMMMSLDGYTAGPEQSAENPFGLGGMQLTEWLFPLAAFRETHGETGGEVNASTRIVEGWFDNIGATVMGRNMFGGGPGPWDDGWKGYWGDEPPYHHPVFVLTHHEREPLQLEGGTTFYFVTTASSRRSDKHETRPAAGTSRSAVERPPSGSSSGQGSWTRS